MTTDDAVPGPAGRSARQAWGMVLRSLRPRATAGHVLTGVLCAVLGFALVAQVRHTQASGLSALRQSDLVRLLEETTTHARELQREVTALEQFRDELATGSNQQQAARDAAEQRAASQGILSGRLPAVGPGIELAIAAAPGTVSASTMVTILTELRNAGAEAIQLGDRRIVAGTFFLDGPDGVIVDGVLLTTPYVWRIIGDSHALSQALEIPGGALSLLRSAGASPSVVTRTEVEITATRQPAEPRFAEPAQAG